MTQKDRKLLEIYLKIYVIVNEYILHFPPIGHYMYTEATFSPDGAIARLWSQPFRPVTGQCLSFYYHMYGANMGNLSVSYGYLNQSTFVIHGLTQFWSLSGDQGDQWLLQNIPLPPPLTQPVNVSYIAIIIMIKNQLLYTWNKPISSQQIPKGMDEVTLHFGLACSLLWFIPSC